VASNERSFGRLDLVSLIPQMSTDFLNFKISENL
jgi:hypothetical protein